MSASARVALYGLGSMGMEVAGRLSRVFHLQVADLNEEALLQAETELGAQRVRCPEDVAQTDFIVLCLPDPGISRSEEHTSELQSRGHLVCRLLLEKNK